MAACRLPALASNYRGRMLLSARLEDEADNNDKDEVHWKPAPKIPRELMPKLAVYRLRALIIAGDELPAFTGGIAGKLGFANSDLGVMVCLAGKQVSNAPFVAPCAKRTSPCCTCLHSPSRLVETSASYLEIVLSAFLYRVGGVLLQLETPRVKVTRGQARWNTLVECDVFLPLGAGGLSVGAASPAPLPDTFIYLYRGDPGTSSSRILPAVPIQLIAQ